jgi:hypothetical protein
VAEKNNLRYGKNATYENFFLVTKGEMRNG